MGSGLSFEACNRTSPDRERERIGDALLVTRFILMNRGRGEAISSAEASGEDGGVGGKRRAGLTITWRMRETYMVASEAISLVKVGDLGDVVNITK
jgi:hypothetical protein